MPVSSPDLTPRSRALKRRQASGTATRPRRRFTIRVDLAHTQPPIWRRLELDSQLRLDQVHVVLQRAFDWMDSHLHEFAELGGGSRRFGPDPNDVGFGQPVESERRTRLGEVLEADGDGLLYVYDFGDTWEHLLAVEAVAPTDPGLPAARVVDGAGAAPPEDCGGVPGYEDLLEIIADPAADPETLEWARASGLHEGFDPAYVDLERLDLAVRSAVT